MCRRTRITPGLRTPGSLRCTNPPAHPLNPPLGKFSDGAIVVGDTTNCPARVDECRVVGGILFSASSKWESIGAVVDL